MGMSRKREAEWHRAWRAGAAIALVLTMAGCASLPSGLGGPAPGAEVSLGSETFSFSHVSYTAFDKYLIQPNDQLDILFQIEPSQDTGPYRITKDDTLTIKFPALPELNETQPVRPDGYISLAYLGDVRVAGRTVPELTGELKDQYARLLRNPEVYVTVPTYLSQVRELKLDLRTTTRGLSRLVTVRPDGVATFPMIGHIPVVGRTIEEANTTLNQAYARAGINIRVDLFLEKHAGSIVYILGEVRDPGAYPITRPVSVLEALALAHGFTTDARLDNVVVARRSGEKMIARRIDLSGPLALDDDGKLFYLNPDDIVYVPRSEISSVAELVNKLADILMFRGWSLGFSWELHKQPSRSK